MATFNHVGLCVTDIERSAAFYTSVFGFEEERRLQPPDNPTAKLLRLEAPLNTTAVYLRKEGFILELLTFDRPGNPPWRERAMNEPGLTHLSVSVDDIPASLEAVRAHGGTVIEETDLGGLAVFVRDPDGQLIEILPSSWR